MFPTTSPCRRWSRAAVGVVGLAALVSACSAGVPERTELVETFERTGMTTVEARCVSDAILDTLTDEQVELMVERGPSGAPVDPTGVTDGPATKVREALTECQVRQTPTTTTTTVPIGDGPTTTAFAPIPGTDGSTVPTDGAELNPASTTGPSTTSTTTP